jgi:hypothetical protein
MFGRLRNWLNGPRETWTPDYIAAHTHSANHRGEVLASDVCGCFNCCKVFVPEQISEWTDEKDGVGQTAICPYCAVDSVIGSRSGFSITPELLKRMSSHWF